MNPTKAKPGASRRRASQGANAWKAASNSNCNPLVTVALIESSCVMTPHDCPRFEHCSAPICPLDGYWQRRTHLPGERVCGLLCELVKQGGEARLRGSLRSELVETLARVAPDLSARWGRIRLQLVRSALTGSKFASGQRLQNTHGRTGGEHG